MTATYTLRAFFCALFALSHTGCITTRPRKMQPQDIALPATFNKSVSLVVTGGQKTHPLWISQVSNEDFAAALQATIEQTHLFSQVVSSGSADYRLDVRLIELKQPMFGFSMTVEAVVEWRVRHLASDRLVFEQTIRRHYTAPVTESFAGAVRLKKANEGAIRENIKTGLGEIAKLRL